MIILKTNSELKLMREANRIIAVILTEIADKIKPGVSTYELDQWAEQRLASMNAKPAFKGYGSRNGRNGFPASLCVAVNEEVVHGIPAKNKILQAGDIIGIDVGSIYKGYHGDGAYTYAVGEVSAGARALMKCCEEALYVGIAQARKGNRVSDISIAIDRFVTPRGYGIVRDLTGHGIGRSLHEEPQVLNYDDGHKGQKLKENMTLAIEPMINGGTYKVRTLSDQWTVVTEDGSLSAHYEHTVLITADGPEILTRL
ncbi:MAG TPA: type I methionyl aminopeptidase [Candidatus Deferrimicrobium sp.]|nr:type I methionyl aminopeptidase [Candidatus Deferrimicrobium sp.]